MSAKKKKVSCHKQLYLKAERDKPPGVKVIKVLQVLFYIRVPSLVQFVPHMGLEKTKESETNWQTVHGLKRQAREASNIYLQFVFKNVLDELGHDRLRAAEDLAHLLVDPLTEEGRVLKHVAPQVRPLEGTTRVNRKGRKQFDAQI